MAKKLTSVLGIDIGSQQIKIAEIKMQGREPAVTALGMAMTPEGTVDHTGVYDVDQISAVVKSLIQASGASVNQVVISIAGQASVLVRTLEVPRMAPAELKEHMQWEINRNIPFAESTVQSDFKAFDPEDAASQNLDVVMAISPQSAIDTLVDIVKKSGKTVSAIDVEPLGLARTLQTGYGEEFSGKTVCVVEIGHKSTSINIYKNGKLLMPRQIPLGGENFTRSIADNMSVSVEEAEFMKKERGSVPASALAVGATFGMNTQAFAPFNPFDAAADLNPGLAVNVPSADPGYAPPPAADGALYNYGADAAPADPYADPAAVVDPYAAAPADPYAATDPYSTQAMDPIPAVDTTPASTDDPEVLRIYNSFAQILDEFLSEVRRSVDYYRSKGGDVDQILLTGGGSKLKGLDQFLASALGVTTDLHDPVKGMRINARRLEPGLLEGNRPDFAVAIGNGLHICFE